MVDEDNSSTWGLRMFVIRREQDRLAPLVPVVPHLLGTNDRDSVWAPGLALSLAEAGPGILCLGSSDRFLGMLASVTGDLDRAEVHLRDAFAQDDANGSPLWAGDGRVWLARIRPMQGHPEEARLLAREVVRSRSPWTAPALRRRPG